MVWRWKTEKVDAALDALRKQVNAKGSRVGGPVVIPLTDEAEKEWNRLAAQADAGRERPSFVKAVASTGGRSMASLAACPECGSPERVHVHSYLPPASLPEHRNYFVRCGIRCVTGPTEHSSERAAEAWNRIFGKRLEVEP